MIWGEVTAEEFSALVQYCVSTGKTFTPAMLDCKCSKQPEIELTEFDGGDSTLNPGEDPATVDSPTAVLIDEKGQVHEKLDIDKEKAMIVMSQGYMENIPVWSGTIPPYMVHMSPARTRDYFDMAVRQQCVLLFGKNILVSVESDVVESGKTVDNLYPLGIYSLKSVTVRLANGSTLGNTAPTSALEETPTFMKNYAGYHELDDTLVRKRINDLINASLVAKQQQSSGDDDTDLISGYDEQTGLPIYEPEDSLLPDYDWLDEVIEELDQDDEFTWSF